jgi:U4/U6.U5 tri-snRNP-associated protein 1
MEEDASAWIERSRRAEAERKAREAQEAAERAAREARERQEAEAYSAQDLRGLRVGHQIEELAEGESLVLTLADTPIIRDGQLNNEEDVLESAKLREQERLRELQQARKRVASGRAYDPADEAAGQPRSILPQYDEEELAARRKKEAGFVLGSEQEIAQRRAEEVRRRLAELEARGTQYSLAAPEIRPLASEYLSAQEIATYGALPHSFAVLLSHASVAGSRSATRAARGWCGRRAPAAW